MKFPFFCTFAPLFFTGWACAQTMDTLAHSEKQGLEPADELPVLRVHLNEQTLYYDLRLEMQGQRLPVTKTRTISKDGDGWIIREESESPWGGGVDEVTLDAGFRVTGRSVEQSGVIIPMTYHAQSVVAEVQGDEKEITFRGAWLSDGPALDHLIAGLTLAPGYELVLEVPDMASARAREVTLRVTGMEILDEERCYVVEIVANDDSGDTMTLWVNPEAGLAEKIEQHIPSMEISMVTLLRSDKPAPPVWKSKTADRKSKRNRKP